MIQPARRFVDVTYAQMSLYFTTWLTGIYINGYVPIHLLPNPTFLFMNAALLLHISAVTLTFSIGIVSFTLAWVHGQKMSAICALLALVAIAVAGTSGLSFALGLGDSDLGSMAMAVGFMTALFLTFFSSISLSFDPSEEWRSVGERYHSLRSLQRGTRSPLGIIYSELALFYVLFLSGMYVNIWVAGDIFAVPPSIAHEALGRATSSPPMIVHATLGILLLAVAVASTASLGLKGKKKWFLLSAVSTSLIGYSAMVGIFNMTGMLERGIWSPGAHNGYLLLLAVSMLSAAGFMAALLICMFLAMEIRKTMATTSGALQQGQ